MAMTHYRWHPIVSRPAPVECALQRCGDPRVHNLT